jgi:hypothetical protein
VVRRLVSHQVTERSSNLPTRKRRGFRTDQKGRSVGERFIKLPHWMMECEAWCSLRLPTRSLLLKVWQRHNGQNNGEISYSVREAAKALGIGKDTASKCFHELREKGFLKAHQEGSFQWKSALATEWQLTMEKHHENPPTKEFMSWRTVPKK